MSERARAMVVFDLGGVVVRICRSWGEACEAAGVDHRPLPEDPALREERRRLVRAYERGAITCGEYFAGVAAATGGLYTPDEVVRVHDAWILEEYAGVADLIARLRSAGVITGVLSNTNHRHWLQLTSGPGRAAKFTTPEQVDHPHASHLLGLAKPDRSVYEAFLARAGGGRVAPGDVIFFDDLADNVRAAIDAGWRADRIDPDAGPAEQIERVLRHEGLL